MKSKLSPWLTGQGIRKCQAFCRMYTIWIWRISGRVRRTNAPIDTVLDSMSLFYRTSGSKQIVYLVEHNNCLLQWREQEIPGFDCIRIQNWNDKKELRILPFLVLLLNASCCCSCNKSLFWLATVTLHMLSWVTSWQFMTRKKRVDSCHHATVSLKMYGTYTIEFANHPKYASYLAFMWKWPVIYFILVHFGPFPPDCKLTLLSMK